MSKFIPNNFLDSSDTNLGEEESGTKFFIRHLREGRSISKDSDASLSEEESGTKFFLKHHIAPRT